LIRTAALAALCVAVGTAAGIAGSPAATKSKPGRASRPVPPPGMFRHGGGPPVHSEAVVLNKARDGFITRTTDAGTVKSVSGDQLAITEGIKTVTYKDATITVPTDATVYRNGAKSALNDLKAGDHVVVSRSPEGTFVAAFDSQHRPRFRGGRHIGPPFRP
jgi:hypothetical protein